MGCTISKRVRVKDVSTQTSYNIRRISNNMNHVRFDNKYIASIPFNRNFGKLDYNSYRKSIEYTNKYHTCNLNYNMCNLMPLRMMSEIVPINPPSPLSV